MCATGFLVIKHVTSFKQTNGPISASNAARPVRFPGEYFSLKSELYSSGGGDFAAAGGDLAAISGYCDVRVGNCDCEVSCRVGTAAAGGGGGGDAGSTVTGESWENTQNAWCW